MKTKKIRIAKTKVLGYAILAILMAGCSSDDNSSVQPDPIQQPDPDPVPVNGSPVAHAGEDQKVEIGKEVPLDASGSSDPDGDVLTYNWVFLEKPEGSDAAIIGVGLVSAGFTMDRAGTYKVELTVGDGKLEVKDDITVTNRTPLINEIFTTTSQSLPENFAQRDKKMHIYGDYFSPIGLDNTEITIGDLTYEIESIDIDLNGGTSDLATVVVPENAVSGNLTVTVGSESVTWTETIRIASLPASLFVETNDQLEERIRDPQGKASEYFEVGTKFKPLVNGTVIGLTLRVPQNENFLVTLWDGATKLPLASETISGSSTGFHHFILLDSHIALEAGKEYVISVNANYWYQYLDPVDDQNIVFPQTLHPFEFISNAVHAGTDRAYPDEAFPLNYVIRGADLIFAEDPQ